LPGPYQATGASTNFTIVQDEAHLARANSTEVAALTG
jgi:hypothetical protein